jgi:protein arginine kinase activator
MKKCRRCTKPATLHITEIRSGQAQALHLCEGCAKEYLNTVAIGGAAEEGTAIGVQPGSEEADDDVQEHDALTCPHCGITFKQFRNQGRLGCPQDYVVFREELLPLIESIHSETQHVGKVPTHATGVSPGQYDLIRLRNDLKSAVQNEMYEEAAQLRDRIQQLESELQQARPKSP